MIELQNLLSCPVKMVISMFSIFINVFTIRQIKNKLNRRELEKYLSIIFMIMTQCASNQFLANVPYIHIYRLVIHVVISVRIIQNKYFFKFQLVFNCLVFILTLIDQYFIIFYYIAGVFINMLFRVLGWDHNIDLAVILICNVYNHSLTLILISIYNLLILVHNQPNISVPNISPYNEVQHLLKEYKLSELEYTTTRQEFNKEQQEKFQQFMVKIESECGLRVSDDQVIIEQESLYKTYSPIQNTIFTLQKIQLFDIQINYDISEEMLDNLRQMLTPYLIEMNLENDISVDELIQLFRHTLFIDRTYHGLQLLCNEKPQFSKQELIALLISLTGCSVVHSMLDDHMVVQLQHWMAMVFNDRSPNQRTALVATIEYGTQNFNIMRNPSAPDTVLLHKLLAIIMLAGDFKQFEALVGKFNAKEENAKLTLFAFVAANIGITQGYSHSDCSFLNNQNFLIEEFGFQLPDQQLVGQLFKMKLKQAMHLLEIDYAKYIDQQQQAE